MKNPEIAGIFNDIADLLEIKGENPFRIRAYRRAALNIEGLSKDVAVISKGELMTVPGIGQDLAGKIEEYVKTGSIHAYEDLKKEIPGGLSAMLSVPGLGPKTAKLLFDKLKIKNIEELERYAREHKLSGLPGIKDKTEEHILKGIDMLKRGMERRPSISFSAGKLGPFRWRRSIPPARQAETSIVPTRPSLWEACDAWTRPRACGRACPIPRCAWRFRRRYERV